MNNRKRSNANGINFTNSTCPNPKQPHQRNTRIKNPFGVFRFKKCFKKGIGCKMGKFTTAKPDYNWFRLQLFYKIKFPQSISFFAFLAFRLTSPPLSSTYPSTGPNILFLRDQKNRTAAPENARDVSSRGRKPMLALPQSQESIGSSSGIQYTPRKIHNFPKHV